MKQIVITHVDGVALQDNITLALDPDKIIYTESVSGACRFLYTENSDRMVKTRLYRSGNTKTQIDGYISGTLQDFNMYNTLGTIAATATTTVRSVQEKYIEQLRTASITVAGSQTSCVEVTYRNAFVKEVLFASGVIGDYSDAALTTTTTTTAATTTTTTAAATTTTTAAATTTTTAAATTTTTAAATTTTTTAAATTTTTTAAATTTTTTAAATTTTTTAAVTTTTTTSP